jgi:thymidylate synthase
MKKAGEVIRLLREEVIYSGDTIHTKSWQGVPSPDDMRELLHYSIYIAMEQSEEKIALECNAKLPWADIHFNERVGGVPLNPPPSYSMWARNLEEFYATGHECFSHSYPERMWSKGLHSGIRYDIADLNTLVEVLKKDPTTRQAYLPFFFPEDLSAAIEGERVPCSLGWHFIIRDGRLDLFYALRSCDVMRHLHNDIYFANRLALWVADKAGLDVVMGNMHLVVTSLHCFVKDRELFEKGFIK